VKHKSGFVNIIGAPNVGKSTLLNALLGEKLSIITNKPQTTRHRIIAMHNTEHHQIVFSDTPGIIEDPSYKMQEAMNHSAYSGYPASTSAQQNRSLQSEGSKKINKLVVCRTSRL